MNGDINTSVTLAIRNQLGEFLLQVLTLQAANAMLQQRVAELEKAAEPVKADADAT